MSYQQRIPFNRRAFLAAATGTALAAAVDVQAAPLLGGGNRKRALASNAIW